MNLNQKLQGQDLQQFLNNFAMLQMMGANGGAGFGGDMNAMMGNGVYNQNNQDNQ